MDGIVCPRLSGLVKFTQKLMTKVQKKKDESGKNSCPICSSRSPKGNLCRACFMRSFTPIAYSRNIKVVEQNEYFYGTGKNKGWVKKPEVSAQRKVADKTEGDILNFVVAANQCSTFEKTFDSVKMMKDNGASSDDNLRDSKEVSELSQSDEQNDSRETSQSLENDDDEFVQVELTDDDKKPEISPEDVLGPLPKFVPDYWESASDEESANKLSDRLKMLTNQVVKEAKRPFKEMFSEPKSESGASVERKSEPAADENKNSLVSSMDSVKGMIKEVQKKLWKQTQTESLEESHENNMKIIADVVAHNCETLNTQLKQNATLELLKVAFKTNMILNSLFYYFKQVVGSESSNSESCMDQDESRIEGLVTADSKISVDSIFFLNKRSAVLWCDKDQKHVSCSGRKFSEHNEMRTERSDSDVEVLSKSQATLSMLMNRNQSWGDFAPEGILRNVQVSSGFEGNYDPCRVEFTRTCERQLSPIRADSEEYNVNLVDCTMGTGTKACRVLDRVWCSEGDCSLPITKVTRKFHSEHSTLIVENRSAVTVCGGNDSYESETKTVDSTKSNSCSDNGVGLVPVNSSLIKISEEFHPPSEVKSDHTQKSLLDLVFGLNRTCVKPSLLPLPDCQRDLITLSTPRPSKETLVANNQRKDAISQTTLSSKHLEQEMSLLHKAFLDQLAHFSVQLVDSCKTFGHSWQTSFLAELVEHFRSACNIISAIIGDSETVAVPSSERLDELQKIADKISMCLAKLRAHPHSFIGDCTDHDISTLLSSPTGQGTPPLVNTWV